MPLFAILIVVALAAIWWLILVRQSGLMAVSLLTLCAGICFGPEFFHVGLLSAERLFVVLLAATYLVLRRLQWTHETPFSSTDALFGLFIVTMVVCTFTHDWTWRDNRPIARLLFYYLLPVVMYFVGRQMRVDTDDVVTMLYSVAAFGGYLAVTSICEKLGFTWVVFPSYIVSAEDVEFLGRGRGPLLNPSGNGILLCLGFFSLLMLWPRVANTGKGIVLALSLVYAGGVFCTMTRCVWLGAMLGAAIVVWYAFPTQLRRVTLVAGLLAGLIAVPALWNRLNNFKRDKHISASQMAESATLRPVLAYVAWEMFLEHPFLGVGLGQYKHVDEVYLNDRTTELVLSRARPYHQHNIVLSLLTEAGLIGAFFFVATQTAWIRAAYLLWKQTSLALVYRQAGLLFLTLQAAYFVNGMFQDVTIVPMVHMTLFFFAGLSTGLYYKHVAVVGRQPHPGASWDQWLRYGTLPT